MAGLALQGKMVVVVVRLLATFAPNPAQADTVWLRPTPGGKRSLVEITPTPVAPLCDVRQVPRFHSEGLAATSLAVEYSELDAAPFLFRTTTTTLTWPHYATYPVFSTVKPQVLHVRCDALFMKDGHRSVHPNKRDCVTIHGPNS